MLTRTTEQRVRERLLQRRFELLERDRRMQRDLSHLDHPLSADFADQAVQRQNDEPLAAIADAAEEELALIDHALEQLTLGSYGTCECCGNGVDRARLRAVPYARMCRRCALQGRM